MTDKDTYRQDDTEQPPESGPTTLGEKAAAYFSEGRRIVDANHHKIVNISCLLLLVWIATEMRSCTSRWSEEGSKRCETSCSMSGDVAYQADTNCMCLTDDGDRYHPYQAREVCND